MSRERTTPRSIVMDDDQWSELGEVAARRGSSAASVVRRLVAAYLTDDSRKVAGTRTHQRGCVVCRISTATDPVGDRQTAGLRNQGGDR